MYTLSDIAVGTDAFMSMDSVHKSFILKTSLVDAVKIFIPTFVKTIHHVWIVNIYVWIMYI